MGAQGSTTRYTSVTEHIPLACTPTLDRLPPSVDLRRRHLKCYTESTNATSITFAVLIALSIECDRASVPLPVPSIKDIEGIVSKGDGTNAFLVVEALNSGSVRSAHADDRDVGHGEACEFPHITLQRVEPSVKTLQAWLASGKSIVCALKVHSDTIEEGHWVRGNGSVVVCCCVVAYSEYKEHFVMQERTVARKGYFKVPFSAIATTVSDAFILDICAYSITQPLFVNR